MRRLEVDPNQLELDFEAQVEQFAEATRAMCEHACAVVRPEMPPADVESEAEFHVEVAAACKRAITESGLSREEMLDRINQYLGRPGPRCGEPAEMDRKRPISIHVFNNHLSAPQGNPMPTKMIRAICAVTGSIVPLEPFMSGLGVAVIGAGERIELLMGKLQQVLSEWSSIKRQLQRAMSGRKP